MLAFQNRNWLTIQHIPLGFITNNNKCRDSQAMQEETPRQGLSKLLGTLNALLKLQLEASVKSQHRKTVLLCPSLQVSSISQMFCSKSFFLPQIGLPHAHDRTAGELQERKHVHNQLFGLLCNLKSPLPSQYLHLAI